MCGIGFIGVFYFNSMENISHSFLVNEAVKHGVNKAIILQHIRYWLTQNRTNNKNIREDYVWTYISSASVVQVFPYFKQSTVRRWLVELEEDGILRSAKYNKKNYDNTKWYTIPKEFCLSPL